MFLSPFFTIERLGSGFVEIGLYKNCHCFNGLRKSKLLTTSSVKHWAIQLRSAWVLSLEKYLNLIMYQDEESLSMSPN